MYPTRLHLIVAWWAATDCGDVDTELARETVGCSPFQWETVGRLVSAPADATSAQVQLEVRDDSDGAVAALFDNAVLAPVVCEGHCGDPAPYVAERSCAAPAVVTASDALYVLGGAVGTLTCTPCICDVDDSGAVTAVDALLTLDAATGAPVSLTCPQ